MSSIQQGIQNAHTIADIFVGYHPIDDNIKYDMIIDWAKNHKTMILLNGGYSETLRTLLKFFNDKKNPYPFTSFNEGEDALDGALTCVGIILPEKIYGASALARKNRGDKISTLDEIQQTGQLIVSADNNTSGEEVVWNYNSWEAKLIAELNNYNLAN